MKLQVGDAAVDFLATDQNGKIHALKDYQGKWLLLYFYPKDDTPGCTIEACNFRDNLDKFAQKLIILGVSGDDSKSHQKFSQKYNLNFPLLADPAKKIIKAYGTDGVIFAKRTSFLISPEGKISKIFTKVDPDKHSEEIIKAIANMRS